MYCSAAGFHVLEVCGLWRRKDSEGRTRVLFSAGFAKHVDRRSGADKAVHVTIEVIVGRGEAHPRGLLESASGSCVCHRGMASFLQPCKPAACWLACYRSLLGRKAAINIGQLAKKTEQRPYYISTQDAIGSTAVGEMASGGQLEGLGM